MPGTTLATGFDLICDRLDEARAAQREANRAQARQWAALAELMRLVRANPHVYLLPEAMGLGDAIEVAQDAAAFDAGLRLRLSAGQVRALAHRAQQLEDSLPLLAAAFADGKTTAAHIGAALDLVIGWDDPSAVSRFDEELLDPSTRSTPSAFRSRARRLKDRLHAEPPTVRHARAFERRRFSVECVDDGMAWLHVLISAPDAVRIASRLNATARAEQKQTRRSDQGWRTRDQHRADLAVAWLAGDGTPTAARVRPVLLVPLLSLLGAGDEPAHLRGFGPIDGTTAARLFADAPSFRRVGTDPFTGEKLVYDRARYRPTSAQRDWIAMRFENCIDPTCDRSVDDSDVDHLDEWARDHGPTDGDNLFPLCEKANRRKNLTRIRYRRRHGGRVIITTPTGFSVTTEEPPF